MKLKFYIISIVVVLLLTGCTSNLNINILNDGKVKESVKVYSPKSIFTIEDSSYESILGDYVDVYKEDLIENNYEYNYNVSDDNLNFTASKNYNDICEYFNSSLFIKNGGSFDCISEDDVYKISGKITAFSCDEDCFESPLVDNVKITISSKLKVLGENASEKEGNTYTWNFGSGRENVFSLTIKKKNSDIIKKKISDIKSNKKIIIIIVIGFVIGLSLVVLSLINKFNKNKIDY